MALLEKAKLENHYGNNEQSIILCNTLIDNKMYLNNEVYLVKGKALENEKEYDLARDNYLKMLEVPSLKRQEKGYYYLGILDFKMLDYDKAIFCLSKVKTNAFYEKDAIYNLICIELRKGNYEQAEIYLNKLLEKDFFIEEDSRYKKLRILIDKGLGKLMDVSEYTNYGEKQFVKYDVEEAIEHIKTEHFGSDKKSNFNENIDIEEMFSYVLSKLTEENLCIDELADVYYIDYLNAGFDQNGIETNCIKVVVIPNTKNILTMYPVDKNNIFHEKENNNSHKVKRLSQIEKFNRKYNFK